MLTDDNKLAMHKTCLIAELMKYCEKCAFNPHLYIKQPSPDDLKGVLKEPVKKESE